MQRLSFIVFFCFIGLGLGYAQSPHGDFLKIDCASCHNPDSWGFSAQANFNHDSTHFPLTGQHRALNCKNCHQSLKFEQADETCISCHADIHQNSVGTDCKRCHSSQNWLIPSALQMHENVAFPLIGVHRNADCRQCHTSASGLDFTVSGVQCIDCHLQDFKGSTSPSHEKIISQQTAPIVTHCQTKIGKPTRSIMHFSHLKKDTIFKTVKVVTKARTIV
ncbi:MAG: hypothetical protein IPM86_11075 [Saprospiraceae bacterium]|nr:hypothetical protein [Saprospiraceae bacterium]